MVIRKLGRNNASVRCGAEEMVSGGIADPLGTGGGGGSEAPEEQDGSSEDCGSASMVSGGVENPLTGGGNKEKEGGSGAKEKPLRTRGWSSAAPSSLERSSAEVITALHKAKQELAKEMEANLKQLKSVLEETQRIAREMEAVLREAKNEPDPEQLATGERQPGQREAGQGNGWKPPRKLQSKRKRSVLPKAQPAWEPPAFKGGQGKDAGPPPWQPPTGEPDQRPQAH